MAIGEGAAGDRADRDRGAAVDEGGGRGRGPGHREGVPKRTRERAWSRARPPAGLGVEPPDDAAQSLARCSGKLLDHRLGASAKPIVRRRIDQHPELLETGNIGGHGTDDDAVGALGGDQIVL